MNMPIDLPRASSAAIRASPALRSCRILRVSQPLVVLASAQRFLPSAVRGPVLLPPCTAHLVLPLIAAAPHWLPVRLDLALH